MALWSCVACRGTCAANYRFRCCMLQTAQLRRCMLPHGALRTAAGAVAVVSPRQQRSSSTTSCSTTRTLLSSARCSAARARATRSSAASSSAPLRTHVATAPMQHAALQRSHRRRSPAPACAQPAEGGGAAAVDGPRRLGFAVPRELQGTTGSSTLSLWGSTGSGRRRSGGC
jgi:hypothetical protein